MLWPTPYPSHLCTSTYLDDVHGGHGQSGTVHHATDVTIEGDVIQVVVGCLNFGGVFLRPIALVEDLFLSEIGVVIEPNLGVETEIYK